MSTRILHLWKYSGITYTVQYLKECHRIVAHFVSGNPVLSSDGIPVSLKGGLPSIIPGKLRSALRLHRVSVVTRGVLSMLQVYRVMKIPGKLKLESISDPFRGQSPSLPKFELRRAIGDMLPFCNFEPRTIKLLNLTTAGANHSVSILGI